MFKSHLFISLILTSILYSQGLWAENCSQTVTLASQTSAADWDKRPPNLIPILTQNFLLLLGVEAAREVQGWDHAFDRKTFPVNTGLDMMMTAITSRLQTGQVPQRIPRFIQEAGKGRKGFVARATLNTLISTSLTLLFWIPSAHAQGSTITPLEGAQALGLCAGFYFCIQAVAQTVFIKIPRRLDARALHRLEVEYGKEIRDWIERVQEKGSKFELSKEEAYERILSALENHLFSIPFENRLPSQHGILIEDGFLSSERIRAKILQATSDSQRLDFRKKLVFQILDELEAHPERIPLYQKTFHLENEGLTYEQELALLQAYRARSTRVKWTVRAGAFVHQVLGGLAGGILLRGLTQSALAD